MPYSTAYRTAAQLTAEARAAASISATNFLLPQWLPNRANPGLTFNFDVNVLNLPDAATFRAYDAEAPFGSVPGGLNRSGQLPPISRKLPVKEYDQLLLQNQPDAIGAKFDSYARRLGLGAEARMELARGQAIETGTVTINENKLQFTVNYGRKSAHTVTAATLLSTLTAPALTYLQAWKTTYVATNLAPWGVAMMSTATLQLLQQNQSLISAAVGRGSTDLPTIISVDQVQAIFNAYGFGRIVVNDQQVNVAGTPQRIISSNKIIFLPDPAQASIFIDGESGVLGGTDWGVPSEIISGKYGVTTGDGPGLFAGAFDKSDPERYDILVSGIGLPVLEGADATFTATVS
jgi:hypothetical protein